MAVTTGSVAPGRFARAAALAYLAPAVGFGLATPVVLAHLARHDELPMTPLGFRALSGPFEGLGRGGFTALGWALVGCCTLDAIAGVWLWRGRRLGAQLGLATTPLTMALGLGFMLPFLLMALPIRVALTAAAWRRLT
jgi:hypothetical protein